MTLISAFTRFFRRKPRAPRIILLGTVGLGVVTAAYFAQARRRGDRCANTP